jgi:hypothetical protein
MKITRKQLTQIIKEEITAVTNKVVGEGAEVAAEGKYADIGRDMKRIKHTNPDSVAKELALLAKDLENMGYGQEAMSLRSWAHGWDLDHRDGREEGELEEYGRALNQPLNPDVARRQQADRDKKVKAAIEAGRGKYGQGAPPIKVGRRYEE